MVSLPRESFTLSLGKIHLCPMGWGRAVFGSYCRQFILPIRVTSTFYSSDGRWPRAQSGSRTFQLKFRWKLKTSSQIILVKSERYVIWRPPPSPSTSLFYLRLRPRQWWVLIKRTSQLKISGTSVLDGNQLVRERGFVTESLNYFCFLLK